MGICIDVTKRVSIEMRTKSVVIVVGDDFQGNIERLEVDFADVAGLEKALTAIKRQNRYMVWERSRT